MKGLLGKRCWEGAEGEGMCGGTVGKDIRGRDCGERDAGGDC